MENYAEQRPYERENYEQFARDQEAAGHEVTHYQGRWFYEGPAVVVDDIQDAIRATSVKCQWDNLGLGWIVYPR